MEHFHFGMDVEEMLTRVGEFWSGQKDSGMGQWPTGTPVLGFGRT